MSEITIDTIAIALSGMPGEAFFAADQVVRNSFRTMALQVKPLVDSAFTAGRESMRSECVNMAEDMRTAYIGGATACVTRHDTKTALDKADAFGAIASGIRALPGKEG